MGTKAIKILCVSDGEIMEIERRFRENDKPRLDVQGAEGNLGAAKDLIYRVGHSMRTADEDSKGTLNDCDIRCLVRGSRRWRRCFWRTWRLQSRRCRSEEHTSELQSLMRISYAVFCLKKKQPKYTDRNT